MRIKTIVIAAILGAAGSGAAHAGCAWHEKQVMSCGEGTVYDAETKTCVPRTTS